MMNDYRNEFDPQAFLEASFKVPEQNKFRDFPIRQLSKFFSSWHVADGASYKVLDYGCGPNIVHEISAAKVATEIVFAEYTEKNRNAVQRWLDKGESAWNWSPFFTYIVQTLEGKSKQEAIEREKQLRSIAKVVPCDITQDPPIAKGFEGPYDLVMSSQCLETACLTQEDYRAAVKNLSSLVKPGGSFILYATIRNDSTIRNDTTKLGSYQLGSARFVYLPLTLEFIRTTLEETGFCNLIVEMLTVVDIPGDKDGTAFVVATKV